MVICGDVSRLVVSVIQSYTGGPRYMREIGTPKIGSHITNSHMKQDQG